jgi:hypothetical protein
MYKSGHKRLSSAAGDFKKKGTEGSLTRIAHEHGYKKALPFARHVMSDKKDFSPKVVKKANWARNMNK